MKSLKASLTDSTSRQQHRSRLLPRPRRSTIQLRHLEDNPPQGPTTDLIPSILALRPSPRSPKSCWTDCRPLKTDHGQTLILVLRHSPKYPSQCLTACPNGPSHHSPQDLNPQGLIHWPPHLTRCCHLVIITTRAQLHPPTIYSTRSAPPPTRSTHSLILGPSRSWIRRASARCSRSTRVPASPQDRSISVPAPRNHSDLAAPQNHLTLDPAARQVLLGPAQHPIHLDHRRERLAYRPAMTSILVLLQPAVRSALLRLGMRYSLTQSKLG